MGIFSPYCISYSSAARFGSRDADVSTDIYQAIKKLCRDLAISEAPEKKNTNTTVHFAFASDANEAAKLVRCFGDYAEVDDTTGSVVWGTRDWLDHEAQEVFPSDIRF